MDKEYNLFKGSLAEHISKTGFRDNETNHYEHEESDDEEIEQKSEMNKSVEELFKSYKFFKIKANFFHQKIALFYIFWFL